jgi:TolA-binding protein
MRVRTTVVLATLIAMATATPLAAPNKEHAQLAADIRMLQEQNQQLTVLLGKVTESLTAINARFDQQADQSRKAFADQKLLVDGVAEGVRLVREKVDDSNVRVSSLSQEVEAVRLAIPSCPPTAVVPPGDPAFPAVPAAPGAPPAPAAAQPPANPAGISPQRMYDTAWADYAAGQWALAIQGFDSYIKAFPKSPMADDAQFNIGQSYYLDNKYPEAIAAFEKVTTTYPGTNAVPDACYKIGL